MDEARRNWFLVFVVFLANAFLVTFGIEELISLLNGLAFKGAPNAALTGIAASFGTLAILLWLLMILALILVPQLPKSVLLPPMLALAWQFAGAPPIKWSMSDPSTWAPINAVGLGSVALAFLGSKISFGTWFLRAGPLPYKENLARRTVLALPVALIVIVVGLAALLTFGVKTVVEQSTGGYLRLGASGIEVQQAVFRKGDQEVHLVGVVHFAEGAFYRNLYAAIPAHAVILAEGVTDRDGKMKKGGLSYNNVAKTLGLDSQDVFEEMLAPEPEQPAAPGAQPVVTPPKKPTVIRADIDVSELSPVTLRFLERVGNVYASTSTDELLRKVNAVSAEFTEADMKIVMDDILAKRDARVLAELDKQLQTFKVAYIPWGAQHMPGLEKGLIDRGFKVESRRMLPLARYQTVLDALLKLTEPAPKSASRTSVLLPIVAAQAGR